jgi:hypothetical protein
LLKAKDPIYILGKHKVMRHKTALAFALLVIIVVSAVALIAQEKNCNIKITFIASDAVPAFHSAPNLENSNGAASFSLTSNTTRTQIYSYIVSNPGVQFRGICMGLGVAVGTAEFHLVYSKRQG